MPRNSEKTLQNLRQRLDKGLSHAEAVPELKSLGLSPIEAIKAIRNLFRISLAEARQVVATHPLYEKEHEQQDLTDLFFDTSIDDSKTDDAISVDETSDEVTIKLDCTKAKIK